MGKVRKWLNSLQLEQYADAFKENAIEWTTLRKLDHELLKELGVKAVGHRVAILDAIERLPDESLVPAELIRVLPSGKAERRQVTVMFCDLVGSTALSERIDPEDYRKVLAGYQSVVSKPVSQYDGYIARYMGDGLLIYFGFPNAHEDDAERAVRAGLEIVAEIRSLSSRIDIALEVRIGIATGTVVAGDIIGEGASEEQAVLGDTPNLAARLQSAASGNSVLISESTRHLVERRFELELLSARTLKGFSKPIAAYRVISVKEMTRFEAANVDGLGPLFGRDEELSLLLRRWDLATAGDGQVVLLGGEAGIGKSRLAEALLQNVDACQHTLVRYQCSPYHVNSAFHPIITQIEWAAGLNRSDAVTEKLGKLEALFGGEPDEQALLAVLLSLSTDRYGTRELTPQKRKSETISLLAKHLAKQSNSLPVLVILEDAHWIDHSTREFFNVITGEAARLHALVIITHRPEFDSLWTAKGHVTQLLLNNLGRRDVQSLVSSVAGNAELPEAVFQKILQKTDGVPLFVEELTKTMIESGFVNNAQSIEVSLEQDIPTTIQDSLVARLDRLGAAKRIAQIGATIGREFPYGLVASVADSTEEDLLEALAGLEGSGLLLRTGVPPDASYTFKHALVRDAAYTTMLRERRSELHQRVADALQQHHTMMIHTQPELLAHHLTEAANIDAALDQWLQAGKLAFSRSAYAEAQAHLEKGLALIGSRANDIKDARRELEFCIALGPVYMTTKGAFAKEVEQVYTRGRELSDKIGDQNTLFKVLWGQWHAKQISGALAVSSQLAQECLSLSKQLKDEGCELQAHHACWSTQFFKGEFSACLEHTELGWDLYDLKRHADHRFQFGGHDPGACSRYFGGMSHWFLGRPDHSTVCAAQSLQLARAIDHPVSLAVALLYSAYVSYFRREHAKTRVLAQEGLNICENLGLPTWVPGLEQLRDWAMVAGESEADALARMGARISLEVVAGQLLPANVLFLVDACTRMGEYKQGAVAAATGLKLAEELGQQWLAAELLRLQAVLTMLGGLGDLNEIKEKLERSLGLAQKQNAKSIELRSAIDLSRLHLRVGDTKNARRLINSVYGGFNEGFDTPDLKDAKTLLDEVS